MKLNILAGASLLLAVAQGCGKSENSKKAPELPKNLVDGTSYGLAIENFPKKATSLIFSAKINVITDGSDEIKTFDIEKVSLAKFIEKLDAISVFSGDTVQMSLSVFDEKGEGIVATNVAEHAKDTELTASIWNSQCKSIFPIDTKVSLINLQSKKINLSEDGKSVLIPVTICDFENLLTEPVLSIQPQEAVLARNVTFQCVLERINGSFYDIYIKNPVCKIGHKPEAAATFENTAPKGTNLSTTYKPEFSIGLVNDLGRDEHTLNVSIEKAFVGLPKFAIQDDACDKMDLVTYELQAPNKEYLIELQRKGTEWTVLNKLGERPALANPASYTLYLHCKWRAPLTSELETL